jgi:hypothetical protein
MKRVVLESPFAGNVERNVAYAKMCIKDMLDRGEAPIASHLLFTQPGILDDNKPEDRKLGIEAGLAWYEGADLVVFYTDFGISNGMKGAMARASNTNIDIEARNLSTAQINELKKKYPD